MIQASRSGPILIIFIPRITLFGGVALLELAYIFLVVETTLALIDPFSCYSAYEHSSLTAQLKPSITHNGPNPLTTALPLDISLETIISVALICVGLVMGAEELQPIEWRVWAGKAEKEGRGGPYMGLEERMGFVDIRVCHSSQVWQRVRMHIAIQIVCFDLANACAGETERIRRLGPKPGKRGEDVA